MLLSTFLGTIDFSKYWNYNGSLTKPPCTEGIKWVIIRKAQPISDIELISFQQYYSNNKAFASGKGNNRDVQPLGKRTLYYNSATAIAANLFAFAYAAYVTF